MNKKKYIESLALLTLFSSTGFAANPASKEYVDQKVTQLQSQIKAIPSGKQGPKGDTGAAGAPGADGIGGKTEAGSGISVTGDGSDANPYVISVAPASSFKKVACTLGSATKVLMVANADSSSGIVWSGNTSVTVPSPGATSTTNGSVNTVAAYNQSSASSAIQLCYELNQGGYQDWYLPAKDELNCLYQNKAAIDAYATGFYWSSTEKGASTAWRQFFGNGFQYADNKFAPLRVRCVRALTP